MTYYNIEYDLMNETTENGQLLQYEFMFKGKLLKPLTEKRKEKQGTHTHTI